MMEVELLEELKIFISIWTMMRVVAQAIRMKMIMLTRTIEESSSIIAEELQQGRLTVPLMR